MLDTILRIAPIVLGPVAAVIITLWYQARKEKRDAKRKLFVTLMASRKQIAFGIDAVNALNLIDVVFADNRQVVNLWHEYYALMCVKPEIDWERAGHTYLQMLSAMSHDLGYKHLQQVDIDKFYWPTGLAFKFEQNSRLQEEMLRVFSNTASLPSEPLKPDSFQPGGSLNIPT